MHKQYGLKRSPALRICKAVALLLFLTFMVSFFSMFLDVDAFERLKGPGKLTEEAKEQLLEDYSFRAVVRLGYKMNENHETYGYFSNIKSVTYLVSMTRNSYGYTSTQTFIRVEKKGGSTMYFKYYKGFELTTAAVYNNHSTSNGTTQTVNTKTFKGAEIKYVEELLAREDAADLVYGFKRDEVTSKRYWKILLKVEFTDIRNYYGSILTICIGSPYTDDRAKQNAVIKVALEDGSELYYAVIGNHVAFTDSTTYYLKNLNEVCFDSYDLEVLYKEVGYIWH